MQGFKVKCTDKKIRDLDELYSLYVDSGNEIKTIMNLTGKSMHYSKSLIRSIETSYFNKNHEFKGCIPEKLPYLNDYEGTIKEFKI